jgi:hypothetical protein
MSRNRQTGPKVYGTAAFTSRIPSFNIKKKLYAQPTQCIDVFCMDLTTNSDHFPRTTTIFITGKYCVYCAVRAEYLMYVRQFSS